MKASELIQQLQELILHHGDKEVYSGGEDYPGRVDAVDRVDQGDGYVPTGAFRVYGGI